MLLSGALIPTRERETKTGLACAALPGSRQWV